MTARLRMRRWQVVACAAAIPLAAVAAYAGTNAWTTLAQRDLRARWERVTAGAPITPIALGTTQFRTGDPIARLAIPAIGLDVIVVEGGNGRRGPAHVPPSAIPGLPGHSTITGGRFGFGNHFLNLSRLTPGDAIGVQTFAGSTTFVVRWVRTGEAVRIDHGADALRPVLTLIAPARTFGAGRIVVRAEAGP